MLSNPETKHCVDSNVIFCVFVLSARADPCELERRLAGLSILSGQAKNTGGCDFTLERILLRSSPSQFIRTQVLVSQLERAVLSSSGDRGSRFLYKAIKGVFVK
mgnify:CR=1 FL=1